MVGGNPLIELAAYLVTGYGGPANVEGSQVLAASWINDMFAGERTCTDASCFYGATGSSFTIPTSFGPAIGLVAPKADPINSFLSELTLAFFRLTSIINFATDVDATQTQAGARWLRRSRRDQPVKLHNDTALSLDGKAPTGHSVGQHVCTG